MPPATSCMSRSNKEWESVLTFVFAKSCTPWRVSDAMPTSAVQVLSEGLTKQVTCMIQHDCTSSHWLFIPKFISPSHHLHFGSGHNSRLPLRRWQSLKPVLKWVVRQVMTSLSPLCKGWYRKRVATFAPTLCFHVFPKEPRLRGKPCCFNRILETCQRLDIV